MGSFFSLLCKPKSEKPQIQLRFYGETNLFNSTPANMDKTPASASKDSTACSSRQEDQVKASKRKRTNDDDMRKSSPKVPRIQSPIPPFRKEPKISTRSPSIEKLKRKRPIEDEGHGASAKAARTYSPVASSDIGDSETVTSAPELKRKRAVEDDEHGASAKVARIYSPIPSSSAYSSDGITSPASAKRKRPLDDEEHGSLSKAARTHLIASSDIDDTDEDTALGTLKRKRCLDDDEHGSLSKAARTYSPVVSSESNFPDGNKPPPTSKRGRSYDPDEDDISSSPRKRTRCSKKTRNTTRLESESPPASSLPANKRTHAASFGDPCDDDEVVEISHKRPHCTSLAHHKESRTDAPTKRKRTLPWLEPDYPYYTKRSRIEIPEDENYPAQATQKYDGLRYYKTDKNSFVKWNKWEVLLGELTHLTVPKTAPVPTASTSTLPSGLLPKPPAPVKAPAPVPKLSRKQRHIQAKAQAKAKARREAKKARKMPPKVWVKKEVKERFMVYAKFNHNMRFSVKIVPELHITSTEYRRMDPEKRKDDSTKGKEDATKGQTPVITETSHHKIHYNQQSKLSLDQFDIYIDLGRMVWEEGWKGVFQNGKKKTVELRDGENVGEGVMEMPGLLAVMRKVMGCPPPDENVKKRIRCFEATGKFGGSVNGI